MKKRILALTVAALLTAGSNVYASETLEVHKLEEKEKFALELNLPEEYYYSDVYLYILNPGKSIDDISLNNALENTKLFQYMKQTTYEKDALRVEFSLNSDNIDNTQRPLYKVYASVSGTDKTLSTEFTVYSDEEKKEELGKINAGNLTGADVELMREIFSLQFISIYDKADSNKVAEKINKLLEQGEEITLDNAESVFAKATVLSLAEGTAMSWSDVVNNNKYINLSAEIIACYENLNDSGRQYLDNGLKGISVSNVEDLQKEITKAMIAAEVYGNKASGNGVLYSVISEHRVFLESNGLDYSQYSSSKKDMVASELFSSGYTSFDKMISDINSLSREYKQSEGSSGNSSGGSFGGSSNKNNSTGGGLPVAGNAAGVKAPEKAEFIDLEGYEWAKESIEYLFERSILKGKENGIFAPADYVTREEFVRMISVAFSLEEGNNVIYFEDIDASRWSYADIQKAAFAGLVYGYDNKFNPSGNITREDMASILMRAVDKKKFYLKAENTDLPFADAGEVSEYARESVALLFHNGVINGKDNNMFCPKAPSTRAEAAKMLHGVLALMDKMLTN